jgi:hypothetical protein
MLDERMKTRAFLIFCAIGLVPIALGYGAKPSVSMDLLFGITVDSTNLTHIMRAVMGLYRRAHTELHHGRPAALATNRLCGPGDCARPDRARTLQETQFNRAPSVPVTKNCTVLARARPVASQTGDVRSPTKMNYSDTHISELDPFGLWAGI